MLLAIVELVAMIAGPAAMALLARAAIAGNLASARGGAPTTDHAVVAAAADQAILMYLAGVGCLAVARAVSVWRGRGNIAAPLLVPAVATALGLGLVVQMGYGDPAHYSGFPGRDAGRDALIAAGLGSLLLVWPWSDPVDWVRRSSTVWLAGLLGMFGLLLFAGSGPAGSDQKLAVAGVQLLEFVKLGFVLWLADFLGRRAAKLRWQREGTSWLRWPRPRVLLPAVASFAATLLGLLLVRDMGPMAVIGTVFLWMLYAVTRSRGWFVLAVAAVGAVIAAALRRPTWLGETFAERVGMYRDPWANGLPVHQEIAEAAWSMAAGGRWGQGPGESMTLLRWGHNDLVLAQLTEDLGFAGLAAWIALIWVMAASCAWVAVRARTAERQLVALGMATLLVAQSAVIFGGVTGWLPLTGIVAPFLAKGGSGFMAFTLAMVIVARIAESGARRSDEDVLRELGWSATEGAVAATLLAVGAGAVGWQRAVVDEDATVRGVLVQLGDHSFRHVHNPRLMRVASSLPRGELHDAAGLGLAINTPTGRAWPLGDALGTLLGPPTSTPARRESWMLERRLDDRLRGWPEREAPFDVWYVDAPDAAVVVLAGEGATREAAEARAAGQPVRNARLPNPDLSRFAPLVRLPRPERDAAVQALIDDVAGRTVRLTLDAQLQERAAKILRANRLGRAAAAVVIDVDTGRVLARAQWPDVDPAAGRWQETGPAFRGVYGPLPDKTGLRGVLQAGSVFKLYTALTATRAAGSLEATHPCELRDAQGPYFTRKGWGQEIHDSSGDPMHGDVALVKGLQVSCNVYFGQLGLDLGAAALTELADLGVEVAWGGPFAPGADGSWKLASTAYGQGAAALHPLAAARLTAAVGAGGVYRRCPPTLEADAACTEVALVPSPARVGPILDGMRLVMTRGTASRLQQPPGLRVYGKTGTADADVTADERAFGVPTSDTKPHSWFVALAEPDAGPASLPTRPGRLAIAVVVPRGGYGASAAGPLAMNILAAAADLHLIGPPPAESR
jgi:cell division protein FtsW (lipid II flippase)